MSRGIALSGLVSGFLFGLGLSVSEMANPEKVLAFLDLLGGWDPSLMVTMAGALVVTTAGFRWVLKRGALFSEQLHLPTRRDVDTRLLSGALLFGLGWGLAGYCPGPAVTGLAINPLESVVFLLAMLAGSQLERLWMVRNPTTQSADG